MFDTFFYAFCFQFGSILLNLGSILLPVWLHFESILVPFASPEGSWGQGHEMRTKCIDFGVPRGPVFGLFFEAFLKHEFVTPKITENGFKMVGDLPLT